MKKPIFYTVLFIFFCMFMQVKAQEKSGQEIYFKIDNVIFAKSSDIEFYDTINHSIQFDLSKRMDFENMQIPVSGLAFGIYVDRDLIYEGKIFSLESSVSCDCIAVVRTIPLSELPSLNIELGYPSENFYTGKDLRNSKKLIEVLVQKKNPVKG
jgi:hypothetical protein